MSRTQLEFARLGCKFVREEVHDPDVPVEKRGLGQLRIVRINGPAQLAAEMKAEVERRTQYLLDGKAIPKRTQRYESSCYTCGDEMQSGDGGDCGLCIAAVQKALAKKKENQQ